MQDCSNRLYQADSYLIESVSFWLGTFGGLTILIYCIWSITRQAVPAQANSYASN